MPLPCGSTYLWETQGLTNTQNINNLLLRSKLLWTILWPRFVTKDDLAWMDRTIPRVVSDVLGEEWAHTVEPDPYFTDFMRYFWIAAAWAVCRLTLSKVGPKGLFIEFRSSNCQRWEETFWLTFMSSLETFLRQNSFFYVSKLLKEKQKLWKWKATHRLQSKSVQRIQILGKSMVDYCCKITYKTVKVEKIYAQTGHQREHCCPVGVQQRHSLETDQCINCSSS